MKAGTSVALAGLSGGSSGIPIGIILKPYVVYLSVHQAAKGIPTTEVWVDAVVGAIVVTLGGLAMLARIYFLPKIAALAQEPPAVDELTARIRERLAHIPTPQPPPPPPRSTSGSGGDV